MTPSELVPISKEDFTKQYWFNPYQNITVINPKDTDMPFMAEGRHFIVEAGANATFPGPIANVYLDKVSRIVAQDKDELGFMADPTLKKLYYDRLIVAVESTIHEVSSTPAYLKNVQPENLRAAPTERAPWDASVGERASDIPVQSPPPVISTPAQQSIEPVKPAESTKSFEFEGNKYKMTVAKDGRKMHFRGTVPISAAEYNKMASLL